MRTGDGVKVATIARVEKEHDEDETEPVESENGGENAVLDQE